MSLETKTKKEWAVIDVKPNPDGSDSVTVRDEDGRIGTSRVYTFPPEIGRALPSNIDELSRPPKPWYTKLKEYLFG